jgi:hypothetical protein
MLNSEQINAVFALYSSVITIRDGVAEDINGNHVEYDISAVNAKVTEMQSAKQTQKAAKASALAKLTALGLSEDEVKALIG